MNRYILPTSLADQHDVGDITTFTSGSHQLLNIGPESMCAAFACMELVSKKVLCCTVSFLTIKQEL